MTPPIDSRHARQPSGAGVSCTPAPAAPAGTTLTRPTPPAQLPAHAQWREVALPDQIIGFVLQRSRRRTIGFLITDAGLRVTAPNWVALRDIDQAVQAKGTWIVTRLAAWQQRQHQLARQRMRWEDGARLSYLGVNIVLRTGGATLHYIGNPDAPQPQDELWLGLPAQADTEHVQRAAQAWLQARARSLIARRLEHFLQRTGLSINRWRLSSARTRWGSCTSRGNIMLNWRLVHFDTGIIDYVIAHELAHLREMNHSPAFWAELGRILPGYQQAQQALRAHDPASLPSFQ